MPIVHIITVITPLTKLRETLKITGIPLRSWWEWSISEESTGTKESHGTTIGLDKEVEVQAKQSGAIVEGNAEEDRFEQDLGNALQENEETI